MNKSPDENKPHKERQKHDISHFLKKREVSSTLKIEQLNETKPLEITLRKREVKREVKKRL